MGLVLAAVLAGFFGARLYKTHKFMSAGLML
jgi:uncharacterized membrane protein (UPF0136 family)